MATKWKEIDSQSCFIATKEVFRAINQNLIFELIIVIEAKSSIKNSSFVYLAYCSEFVEVPTSVRPFQRDNH